MAIIRKQTSNQPRPLKQWLDPEGYFIFGKYGGSNRTHIEDVASDDPGYLRWIVNSVEDISEEDRAIISGYLHYSNRLSNLDKRLR